MKNYHKITSYFHDKRKILRQKFWSLGTNLGYLGPGSQADLGEIFSKPQIVVIWDPIPSLGYKGHGEIA